MGTRFKRLVTHRDVIRRDCIDAAKALTEEIVFPALSS
jgi:hypothetical protein